MTGSHDGLTDEQRRKYWDKAAEAGIHTDPRQTWVNATEVGQYITWLENRVDALEGTLERLTEVVYRLEGT